MKDKKKILILVFVLLALSVEALFVWTEEYKARIILQEENRTNNKIYYLLDNLPLEAQAVSVFDLSKNKKIYGLNDDVRLPIASLAKIMTSLIALRESRYEKEKIISSRSILEEGDSGLKHLEKFDVSDLVKFVLVGSVNDGAYALLENVPNALEKMNIKAKKLGMLKTVFLNFTGLDIDSEKAGAYASASDVNFMASYALSAFPEKMRDTTLPEIEIFSQNGVKHSVKNTNMILNKIPNIFFSKTGFTPLAGGNLTIAFENNFGRKFLVTVMGSSREGRFKDMEKIVEVLNTLE